MADQGGTSYDLFESGAAPGTLVTVESWSSRADPDADREADREADDVAAAFAAPTEHFGGDVAIHPLRPVGAVGR